MKTFLGPRTRLSWIAAVAVPLLATALAGCGTASRRGGSDDGHEDLGSFHRKVSTNSPEAQKWFDRGLVLSYGFNHEEAIACYQRAVEVDPGLAMAYWGMAWAAGPNINNPAMDEIAALAASENARTARELANFASPVEQDLIEAIGKRYASPPPADRKPLDAAFAAAMREVWKKHPRDPDVGAIFAESLMDLRPWDLWTPDGKPQPETPEILETLEAVIALAPQHPGANHYTIHALEASPHPERALPAADRLRMLVPGAGHLLHMPAHIDIRVGHYDESVKANERGIAADLRYVKRVGRKGFYNLYRAHNYHFLAWSAMYEGRRKLAESAAREMVREIPPEAVRAMPDFLEAFQAVPYHVLVRFGRWKEILREPAPSAEAPSVVPVWRYARGLALSAQGKVEEAEVERKEFEKSMAAVPESRAVSNNPVRSILEIARRMLEGEIEYRKKNHDRAFALLREAVVLDDALRYDEPWGWMQPARHALGALLLEQGRLEEAEKVYREDLTRHPENGWALHGLAECLRRKGDVPGAEAVEARFQKAWARADARISSSCYCRTGA